MRKFAISFLILCFTVLVFAFPIQSQMATMGEALNVANNWVALIIQKKGDWGGVQTATVEDVQEFKRRGKTIGYFCHVKPQGFIVVSLLKELAPVKAYSAVSCLDPASEEALVDVIKGGMDRVLTTIEKQLGPIKSVQTQDLSDMLDIDYHQSWVKLSGSVKSFVNGIESDEIEMDYQGGGPPLLSSSWHQRSPYNQYCPIGNTGCPDCCPSDPGTCPPTQPTVVGCVATAGAQIMKYWNWPPYGYENPGSYTWDGDDSCSVGGTVGGGDLSVTITDSYDWAHMANRYVWNTTPNPDRWEDEKGNPLTQAHLDAVAELCYEVGVSVEMDYGACGSGAQTSDMKDVFPDHYYYSTACSRADREDYSSSGLWFEHLKDQFNLNRPVQYRILGHSIVGDGWQKVTINDELTKQYHMNYGWGRICATQDGCNTWYTVDTLFYPVSGSTLDDEYIVENIVPSVAMGSLFWGDKLRNGEFPFRYFDQDAISEWATFYAHNIQFLPGVTVTCGPVPPNAASQIEFIGYNILNCRLFSRGDMSRGIRIQGGGGEGIVKASLVLYDRGSIKFH